MATIFDLPELLLNVMSFVKADPLSFTRCLSVDKRWREIVIENAQQLLADDVYERCQGATVSVGCLNEPFEFRVPGYQAQLLAIAGAIECKDDKLSFRSRDTAEHWWKTARRYVEVKPQHRPNPLTVIDGMYGGRLMAPVVRPETGQLWFWVRESGKIRSLDETKEELLKAFKSTEPHVVIGAAGLGLVGFDGRDRIWFQSSHSHMLHGLNETEYVTLESKTRTEAGIPKKDSPYKEYFHTGEINALKEPICALDRENRFYISDSVGVHIIHPDAPAHFDYFSTYKINYEKGIFYEKSETFSTLYKYVDTTGKLFVWSTPGIGGWSGTVGYWTFDGTKWENVDIVQGIYDIAVRVLKNTRQIWLFKARDVKILEEPLSGNTKPVELSLKELTGVESAYYNRVLARSEDRHESVAFLGEKSVLLDSKNHRREPQVLPDNVQKLFKVVDLPRVGWGNNTLKDGVIYFSNEKVIIAASVDGKSVTNYSCTETLPDPRIHYVLTKPRKYGKPLQMIYLKAGIKTYLLDPSVKFVDFSGLPGVYLATSDVAPPTPEGRVLFNAQSKLYEWQADQLPRPLSMKLASDSQCNLIHGTGGLMISHASMACLHFNNQTITEDNLETLADKHYDKLIKHLPFPPRHPFGVHLIHDGLGNIWISRNDKISVRTPKGLISFDTKNHRSPEGYFSVNAMTPLGDGSAIVLVSKYKSLLLTLDKERKSLKGEPTNIPIGVQYTIYSAEWKENMFYDKKGTAYVLSEEWNNGMQFKTYYTDEKKNLSVLKGKLLLIDRHNGKWFYQDRTTSPSMLIYRPYKSTEEFTLEISLKQETMSEDFLVDNSVWLFLAGGMTRVKFNGTALEITEELKVVVPNRVRSVAADGRHVLWNAEYKLCGAMVLDEKYFK